MSMIEFVHSESYRYQLREIEKCNDQLEYHAELGILYIYNH